MGTTEKDLLKIKEASGISLDFNDYAHIDTDVTTCTENTVYNIVAELAQYNSEDEAELEDEVLAEPVIVTAQQKELALEALWIFSQQEQDLECYLRNLSEMGNFIKEKRLRQMKQPKVQPFLTV